ncbi:NADPH:quinone oxidoreductase family protein (plasmid) [Deinococcus metallilatus]|uniref:NADPH2:quinone reductase n=1 Tax=Deinococcus metallilatus TaxID=1211322 RepID=A0AAJ5JZD3_9DEIO|nr:NADPH:quinone oxidoreductase family protein [Deinococcus metallilatus]MBB5297286.1 NADPH2:quinone reductase [Deinococcus metallilatus]QBY06968.1 NADPH:quinone oxidoreductase family protein [Deinococcus metallilatus]TLK31915.1 NADPH:quinone oxidoreductase family protein [Deinococcus metallilatus]GMA17150.1 NADPH:quinone oxidoreductase [Deinococcus metallilatus]
MRALICTAFDQPETLTVQTVPDPTPGPGEVVLDVQAAGVNYPDALMVLGQYQVKPPLPFTPGAEAAGVISAVGEGVTHLWPGQRAVAFTGTGAFAEKLLAPASVVMPLPDDLEFDVAAGLPLAYGTSMHALVDRAQLKEGETLLVLGAAGGVGLAAVMIGKALGARVIAAASSEEKLKLCREHGADETLNYATENLRERLKALTGGKGPDVIFDPVGGDLAEPAFRSIGWEGRYLVVGFAGGEIPRLPLNLPLLKGASLVGVFWGEFARRDPRANAHNMARLAAWVADGTIKPLVSERYPLERTPEALRALLDRRVTGKVVVTP